VAIEKHDCKFARWSDAEQLFKCAAYDTRDVNCDPNDCLTFKLVRENNAVYEPPHYTQGGVECIDAIQSALTKEEFRGYCKAVIMKYVWRESHKAGTQDLKKARQYLNRLINLDEGRTMDLWKQH